MAAPRGRAGGAGGARPEGAALATRPRVEGAAVSQLNVTGCDRQGAADDQGQAALGGTVGEITQIRIADCRLEEKKPLPLRSCQSEICNLKQRTPCLACNVA